MAHIPHQRRIREYFRANPDEWLSIADICAKFGISELMARKAICEANAGTPVIERVSVYRLRVVKVPA